MGDIDPRVLDDEVTVSPLRGLIWQVFFFYSYVTPPGFDMAGIFFYSYVTPPGFDMAGIFFL
jgi:hypothetical protein